MFSFRNEAQAWNPKRQRPEFWKLYNTQLKKGESIRVFPLSNWTEKDIWQYILRENIEIVSLYYAAERPVVSRGGNLILVDDARMRLLPGEAPVLKKVRFRTLGCYPLTGGCLLYTSCKAARQRERDAGALEHFPGPGCRCRGAAFFSRLPPVRTGTSAL